MKEFIVNVFKIILPTLIIAFVICILILVVFPYILNPDPQINPEKVLDNYIQKQFQKNLQKTAKHLMQKFNITKYDIYLEKTLRKTWTDNFLNCPVENQPTVPAKNNGWLFIWKFGDKYFEYHTTLGGHVIYCGEIDKDKLLINEKTIS